MKNKKGSTIVWAITLIMVLVVIVGASLSFAYISYNKAIQDKSKTQAELTAQSVAQALVNQMSQSTSSETFEGQDQIIAENTRKLIPENDGDIKRIESSDIKISNKKLGIVNYVTITRNQNNQLTIVVKATYANQTSTVKAIMKKETDGNQWNIYRYEGASS